MRVGVDVSVVAEGGGGGARYVLQLARTLPQVDGSIDLTYLYVGTRLSPLARSLAEETRGSNARFRSWPLPKRALAFFEKSVNWLSVETLSGDIDVYHQTFGGVPLLPRRAKLVSTIFDLIPEKFPNFNLPQEVERHRRMVVSLVRHSQIIIAGSHSTKRDLVEILGVDPKRIRVVYCGVEERFHPQEEKEMAGTLAQYGLEPKRYLLFLGILEIRKNLPNLFKAFKLLLDRKQVDLPLVLAGPRGWLSDEIFEAVERLHLSDRVRFLGYVPENHLPALLSGALVFVYPSLYEGFGLPVLEAMACGTPVVASNISSIPEVVGDVGLLFDPRSEEEMTDTISRVLSDGGLRRDLKEKGLKRAACFSWRRTAQETVQVYKELAPQAEG